MLNIISDILKKMLIVNFLLTLFDVIKNINLLSKININIIIIVIILLYILIDTLLLKKNKEKFDNEKPKTNVELSPMIKSSLEEKNDVEVETEMENDVEVETEMENDVEVETEMENDVKVSYKNMLKDDKKIKKEDLKEIQDKYIIMPIESWISNDISLMQKKQVGESCSCPTLLEGNYMNY